VSSIINVRTRFIAETQTNTNQCGSVMAENIRTYGNLEAGAVEIRTEYENNSVQTIDIYCLSVVAQLESGCSVKSQR
jgi:hypothetical protein